jgi:hypothetical protein
MAGVGQQTAVSRWVWLGRKKKWSKTNGKSCQAANTTCWITEVFSAEAGVSSFDETRFERKEIIENKRMHARLGQMWKA